MLENYLPIIIFILVAAVLGVLMLLLGFLFGKGDKSDAKLSPYECGFEEFEDARIPFDVRYYLYCYILLVQCVTPHYSITKKYRNAFKTGMASGAGQLTPSMFNKMANPLYIESIKWLEIGRLLQGLLQASYDLEH